MFNPEKLLGGLIRSSTRGSRGGLGGLMSGGAALGMLGVAMEAVEHFMNNPKGASAPSQGPGGPPPIPGSAPPSPPVMGSSSAALKPPPPPPMPGRPPRVPPAPAAVEPAGNPEAVLLIRSMIAAANADGVIDQTERNHILERLQTIDLSPEEHTFIVRELLSPVDLETIVGGVTSPEMARQVYTVSLMAIDVDTEAERRYMDTLASRLGLDESTVGQIQHSLNPQ
ncbi:tellurite resistance TerB family protein [uncultured Desulfosarcina sp.]|uniref:tellurite resistance TerB family protein n=1 Tax=uncultured Desulfosarcina sp. TaxID=218289 RepID=UPI0029C65449|nr:tellurite resistance TerB family protein [uncultured Desulfosarcina sp.]